MQMMGHQYPPDRRAHRIEERGARIVPLDVERIVAQDRGRGEQGERHRGHHQLRTVELDGARHEA